MAQLNFPDPTSTTTFTDAGITWTWNATLGVWSTDDQDGFTQSVADARYLRVDDEAPNQTRASGLVTFGELTTHEAGVSVTGSNGNVALNSGPVVSSTQTNVVAIRARPDLGAATDGTLTNYTAFNANNFSNGFSGGLRDVKAYTMSELHNLGGNNAGDVVYGYYAPLENVTEKPNLSVYNFYAAGAAPNYFAGGLKLAESPDDAIGLNNFDTGIYLTASNGLGAFNRSGGTSSANPCLILRRNNTNSTGGWRAIEMYNHDNSSSGFLKISGSTTRVIDSRLGATGVAMADGAADIVKALQPKVITQGGETFNGFLPADLVGTFAAAVDGEAGATLAIGTYTDPDGVVETEVEEPEAIPFGGSWQQTGTRDLMQGVSRGELIPLLTKALQETIAKNEELEARLSALEGA